MKRDLELVRSILLDVEATERGQAIGRFAFEGKTDAEVAEHVALLTEAGYVDAIIRNGVTGTPNGFVVKRLTWSGHEFLANAKNEAVWKKVMNQAIFHRFFRLFPTNSLFVQRASNPTVRFGLSIFSVYNQDVA